MKDWFLSAHHFLPLLPESTEKTIQFSVVDSNRRIWYQPSAFYRILRTRNFGTAAKIIVRIVSLLFYAVSANLYHMPLTQQWAY